MKRIQKILIGSFFALIFAAFASQALASVVKFNDGTHGPDCPTIMVGNYDDGTPKNPYCWPTSVPADPNESINVIVYYHNTGDQDATNTRVKISPQYTTASFNHTFSGSVWADNYVDNAYDSGSATVNLSASQTLTYGSVKWYPNQSNTPVSLPFGQNGSEIFSSSGLNLGTVEDKVGCPSSQTFCHQGWVMVSFKVGTTPPPPTTSCTANLSANPSSVSSGGTSILSWSTTGATSISITGGPVQYYNPTSPSGSVATLPIYGSTTYTLTANCNGTSKTSVTTVNINSSQTCSIDSFEADDDSISEGDTTELEWNTTGGTSISLSGDIDGNIDSNDFDGSIDTDELDNDETFTLTLYCANGQIDTDQVEVEVDEEEDEECKVDDFYASPSSTTVGGYTTLHWKTTDADDVSIFGGFFTKTNLSDDGSVTVGPIYGSTTFTVEASCDGDSDTDTTSVSINSVPPPPVAQLSVLTTAATSITQSSARLNGLVVTTGGTSVTGYFEYGTTQNLGQRTADQVVGTLNSTNFWNTIATTANTTYYYRAVGTNAYGAVARGDIVSFTTPATVSNTQQVVYVNTSSGTGNGSPLIALTIEDRFNTFTSFGNGTATLTADPIVSIATPGDTIDYVVTYKNVSGRNLYNTIVTVVFPKNLAFLQSSVGGYSERDRTLSLPVGTLTPNEEGVIYIQAKLSIVAKAGETLVTTATAVFTTSQAVNAPQNDAIAYALLQVSRNGFLAGLALFGGDFFPTTLLGWIILLLIIALLIALARRLYRRTLPPMIHTRTTYNPPSGTPMGHA